MIQVLSRNHRGIAIVGILLAASLACSIGQRATPTVGGPTVTLTAPLPGQTAPVGEPLSVNSTSVDTDGVARIELWVEGKLFRVDSNPDISSPYIVQQTWLSDEPGTYVIVVKAFDAQGAEGQSEPVTITLETATQLAKEPEEVTQETPTPAGLATATTPLVPTSTLPPAPKSPRPATATSTPALLTPTSTPLVTCTPPPCKTDEQFYCPGDCPGGCGTQCATPTTTPTPPSFKPTGIEIHTIFQPVWEQPQIRDYIGYPTDAASADRRYARQYFERGYLYWWDRPDAESLIWAMEIPQPGARQGFRWSGPYEDTWDGDKTYTCDAARANPDGPIRGFGKLWCDRPEIAEAIGSARGSEQGTADSTSYGVVQFFQGGLMLYSPADREVWVLFNGGTWQRHSR